MAAAVNGVSSHASSDGVLTLTLDRPGRGNAYTYDLEAELHRKLIAADSDPQVRAVVITGAGRTFCPGFDSEAIRAGVQAGRTQAPKSGYPFTLATRLNTPILVAINGACVGVGLALALTADIRVCASSARFSTAFVTLGLPAERATSWLLPRIVGHGDAMDLLLTGREIDAAEARRMGLVSAVVEPSELATYTDSVAVRLARTSSPNAMATIKRQLYADWTRSVDASAAWASVELDQLLAGPDFRAAVAARAEGVHSPFEGPRDLA